MECPRCGTSNPTGASRCAKCDAPLAPASSKGLSGESQSIRTAGEGETSDLDIFSVVHPGTVLGGRYEILELLGAGGMGAVYKAKDREVDRLVAIKVIRRELAAKPDVVRRFKQELILARKVTHKNVIRIYDLGEAEGVKFITMEFVEGRDLRTILTERGKLPPEDAAGIIVQVCRALDAAHSEGVVHRDLKPQNIMVDKQGRVTVMDFGIARSMETPGMTQTGVLVGTPEYMSPEQAKGEEADARSDLFSVGIIFYELLTGKSPYRASSAVAMLVKRAQERAVPPVREDPSIPRDLSDIAVKCLETDPQRRYQSAQEVLRDLEVRRGVRSGVLRAALRARLEWFAGRRTLAMVAGAVVVFVAASLFVLREKMFVPRRAAQKAATVLVADFINTTSEPLFDGALEPTFSIALEGASFITAYNRGQAHQTAAQVRPGATGLDEALARLVAVREGINVVVAGSIARQGDHYNISSKAVDAVTGGTIAISEINARDKDAVLRAVDTLAARVRTALGDATPESVQIAAAETFSTSSLEAAHEYAIAQDFQWAGKYGDAIQHYSKATEFDPNLGRAYSGLAAVYANMGRRQDSEKYYKLALSKMDRMSDREKYRTRSGYYLLTRNSDKAIEELSQFVEQYPSDTAGIANLALAYFFRRDMSRALQEGRRAVEIYPKNVIQRNNLGLYAMYAGDFDTGIREQRSVLEMNPSFVLAYVGTALSELAEGRSGEAAETYQRMEKLGPQGASAASIGLADLALYEGRAADAVGDLEKGIAGDFENKNPDSAANKLTTLAYAQLLSGHRALARSAADKAVATSKEDNVLFWAARVNLGFDDETRALALAQSLAGRLETDPQAYAKLIDGEVELKRGRAADAVKLFREAQKLADTWFGRFDLGLAYLDAEAFTEAYSEFELCLKRRGEATAAFLDEVPTYRLVPPVYYYLGRAQEGLKSPAAADSYKTFLAIKEKSGEDPLVADARRRIGLR